MDSNQEIFAADDIIFSAWDRVTRALSIDDIGIAICYRRYRRASYRYSTRTVMVPPIVPLGHHDYPLIVRKVWPTLPEGWRNYVTPMEYLLLHEVSHSGGVCDDRPHGRQFQERLRRNVAAFIRGVGST